MINKYVGTKTNENLWQLVTLTIHVTGVYQAAARRAWEEGCNVLCTLLWNMSLETERYVKLLLLELGEVDLAEAGNYGVHDGMPLPRTLMEPIAKILSWIIHSDEFDWDIFQTAATTAKEESFPILAQKLRQISAKKQYNKGTLQKILTDGRLCKEKDHASSITECVHLWRCQGCGRMVVGEKAPGICPDCTWSQHAEIRGDQNPFAQKTSSYE